MIRRLFLVAVVEVLAGVIVKAIGHDVQRYMKIREM